MRDWLEQVAQRYVLLLLRALFSLLILAASQPPEWSAVELCSDVMEGTEQIVSCVW